MKQPRRPKRKYETYWRECPRKKMTRWVREGRVSGLRLAALGVPLNLMKTYQADEAYRVVGGMVQL